MKITGKLYEIGHLESVNGIGVSVEVSDGETVQIIGMAKVECRQLASLLGEQVSITVEAA